MIFTRKTQMLEELIEVQRLAMEAIAVQNKDLMHVNLQKILEVTQSLMLPAALPLSSADSSDKINPGDVLLAADGREFKIDFEPSSILADLAPVQAQDTKDASDKIASARKAAKGKK